MRMPIPQRFRFFKVTSVGCCQKCFLPAHLSFAWNFRGQFHSFRSLRNANRSAWKALCAWNKTINLCRIKKNTTVWLTNESQKESLICFGKSDICWELFKANVWAIRFKKITTELLRWKEQFMLTLPNRGYEARLSPLSPVSGSAHSGLQSAQNSVSLTDHHPVWQLNLNHKNYKRILCPQSALLTLTTQNEHQKSIQHFQAWI